MNLSIFISGIKGSLVCEGSDILVNTTPGICKVLGSGVAVLIQSSILKQIYISLFNSKNLSRGVDHNGHKGLCVRIFIEDIIIFIKIK
jgi:hypothetical protein